MNNKVIMGIIAAIIIIGGAYMLMQKQSSPVPQQNQTSTGQQATGEPNTVTIKDFAFSPDTLTVKEGTKVTWVNNDSATHTIKSDTFNSPDIGQGNKFEFTFTTKGSFDYSCGIHPSMKGKVVVQ